MKKLFVILLIGIIVGGYVGISYIDPILNPEPESLLQDGKTIEVSGVIGSERFWGTEAACEFTEDAPIGSQSPCNVGGVQLFVEYEGEHIRLIDYKCDAVQVLTKINEDESMDVYNVSDCTDGLAAGTLASFKGTLELRENQWYGGQQQNEWWMMVQEVTRNPL